MSRDLVFWMAAMALVVSCMSLAVMLAWVL